MIGSITKALRAVGCVVFLGLMPGWAAAACAPEDFRGTWYVLGVAGDVSYGALTEIDRCKISLTSYGRLAPGSSSCFYRYGNGTGTMTVSGAAFYVSSGCVVDGTMRVCTAAGCGTLRTQAGQIARDKNTMTMPMFLHDNRSIVAFYKFVKQ